MRPRTGRQQAMDFPPSGVNHGHRNKLPFQRIGNVRAESGHGHESPRGQRDFDGLPRNEFAATIYTFGGGLAGKFLPPVSNPPFK